MRKIANIELIRKFHYVKKDQSGSYQKTGGIHDRRSGKHKPLPCAELNVLLLCNIK